MAQSNAQKQLQQYDTDIAVLKVEFKNLDTKFDTALEDVKADIKVNSCLLYTSPSPRDATLSRMPSSA